MAHSGTQTLEAASELVSDRAQPDAISDLAALNHHPSVLAARELIREARQHVARSRHLIERGKFLRQQAEQTLQAFRRDESNP